MRLHFDNSFARLPGALFGRVLPTPLPDPYPVAFNPDVAALLTADARDTAPEGGWEHVFAGNRLPPGAEPIATLYAGFQFGAWVPQLGDGRAILLGEAIAADGRRWDVQLKGAGPTPYSRGFDGRAVLRSCIREYLAGEAMAGLGIPTTRSLCIVGSPSPVFRETMETAAVLTRVAGSHLRFGHFDVLARNGLWALLPVLSEYAVRREFPGLAGDGPRDDDLPVEGPFPDPPPRRGGPWDEGLPPVTEAPPAVRRRAARMLVEAVTRTARLMAGWTGAGFCHGVMNTDNMSLAGDTLDYGPFGFLDVHDPGHVCNHSDDTGRYAFERQAKVALWNCCRLAEALVPLVGEKAAIAALDRYPPAYNERLREVLRGKLGLATQDPDDGVLGTALTDVMAEGAADHTLAFRLLSEVPAPGGPSPDEGAAGEARWRARFRGEAVGARLDDWLARWRRRLESEPAAALATRRDRMRRTNPARVLRNWMAESVIRSAGAGDFGPIEEMRLALRDPFTDGVGRPEWQLPPPEWGRCLVVGCSS